MTALPHIAEPADLTWVRALETYDGLDALAGCPQEPAFHGEGDVATHTRMVLAALADDDRYWSLRSAVRDEVAAAAAFHDVGKPSTTRVEDGRIRQPGHARRGEVMTRVALWEKGVDPPVRERVANLVRFHLAPFHLLGDTRPIERLFHASWTCDGVAGLMALAAADAAGRISESRDELIERVELARLLAEEHGVLDAPYAFGSDHARVQWFRRPDRDPAYVPFDDTRADVTVMSGPPAAGKDHWIRRHADHLPVVSLDELRRDLGVPPHKPQGVVVAAARELARTHLRAGRPFVWNGTNLSRRVRSRVVDLALDYGVRVRIVAIESPPDVVAKRNAERERPVPAAAIDRMLGSWEFPDPTEAHEVVTVWGQHDG